MDNQESNMTEDVGLHWPVLEKRQPAVCEAEVDHSQNGRGEETETRPAEGAGDGAISTHLHPTHGQQGERLHFYPQVEILNPLAASSNKRRLSSHECSNVSVGKKSKAEDVSE
jgi:hypothetical protein